MLSVLVSVSPHHVFCLGTSLHIPDSLISITAKGKPPLLAKPLGGPGAADILTAKHSGVEVEGSAFLLPGALCGGLASGLGLCGASLFLPGFEDLT